MLDIVILPCLKAKVLSCNAIYVRERTRVKRFDGRTLKFLPPDSSTSLMRPRRPRSLNDILQGCIELLGSELRSRILFFFFTSLLNGGHESLRVPLDSTGKYFLESRILGNGREMNSIRSFDMLHSPCVKSKTSHWYRIG